MSKAKMIAMMRAVTSTKTRVTKKLGETRWSSYSSGGEGTQQSTTKATKMARNVVAITASG